MSSKSTVLKNKGSVAKRTATAMRSIADDPAFDIADRGVLLAAAKIVDSYGYRKSKEATAAKAQEAKYERDNKAARAKIEPAVKALDCKSISDKVAVVCLINHFYSHLVRALNQPTQREIQWELDYFAQQAISDTIANASYWVATGKGSAEQAIQDIKAKHLEVKTDPKILAIAGRFVRALQPTEQVAA